MTKQLPPDRPNLPSTHAEIKRLLKEEAPRTELAARLRFSPKVLQYVIDRYELEEDLRVPKLVGIK